MSEQSDIKANLAILSILGSLSAVNQKLIDRGYLFCIPCGTARQVTQNGDVAFCQVCGAKSYNLYGKPPWSE